MTIIENLIEKEAINNLKARCKLKTSLFKFNKKGQVIRLSIKNKKLKQIPEDISQFSQLEELSLP